MKRIHGFLAGLLAIAVFTSTASADILGDTGEKLAEMVKDMQKQMAEMKSTIDRQNEKIRQLETRGPQVHSAPAAGAPEAGGATPPMSDYEYMQRFDTMTGGAQKWLKDLKFIGDYRLRYEAFNYTNGTTSESDDRNRFRYRLRFGFEKKFSEQLKAGFGLASGESGATGSNGLNVDPTSTNTTLTNDFNFKPVFIEKAYVVYNPEFMRIGPVTNVEFGGGKVNNPFERGSSDMIWDRDVKPEGVYEKVELGLLDTENFDLKSYFQAGQFIIQERASGGDSELYAFQLGINPTFYIPGVERPVDWLTAASFYDYSDYATNSNFAISGNSLARGNPLIPGSTTDLAASTFKVFEIYNEIGLTPFGVPVRPFFDAAWNPVNEADSDGSTVPGTGGAYAWALGGKLGSIVKKGDWEASYAYKYIGANAVVGAWNDSDFGDGHSGKVGSVFKLGYALMDNVTLNGAAFFVNNTNTGTGGVLDQETRRFQVDLNWKFA